MLELFNFWNSTIYLMKTRNLNFKTEKMKKNKVKKEYIDRYTNN